MLIGVVVHQIGNQPLDSITILVTMGSNKLELQKKQNRVALSSCEAEYKGMCAAVHEAIFLRQLLADLFIPQVKPTQIAEEKQSCMKFCINPVFHKRSKHVSTKLHFIRETGK